MKTRYFTTTICILTLVIFVANVNAQISQGGNPPSIIYQIDDVYDILELTKPDMAVINEEDQLNESSNPQSPRRMGVSVIIGKDMSEIGTWTDIEGIGSIWRVKLKVKDALALGVYYSKFNIPKGGQLFIYNDDKTRIIGAFTSDNNPDNNLFATEFIPGDEVTLEYFKPMDVTEEAVINISELAYAYRLIDYSYSKGADSWWCMINVACEEGDGWEKQIRGVARMSIKIGWSYYWCSGSLINNTDNDRTPYFLSAAHCGEGSTSNDRAQWVFYFNYQASTCSGTSSGSNSITGCQLRARDDSYADAGSDFDLMEFNTTIPDSYNVYYNGWNRTNSNDDAGNGVGIHHPAGDIKKISTYDTPLQPSTFWNGLPSHWKLLWAETINGKSIMQGGSSGSPVFDSNGLIMGDLTGGYTSNSCTSPSPAYYGKIWYSWDQNGTTSSTQLKPWLDPGNTGIEKLQGVSWEIIPPIADYEANNTIITQGDTVFFTDLSEPGIMTWDWAFEGGDPISSSIQNPFVVYSDTGYFDVSLTVENADGTDTEIKEDYIYVQQLQLPQTDFEANETSVQPGAIVYFTDLTLNNPTSWVWTLEGGSPSTSTTQNPIIRYNNAGIFDVKLVASNLGGSDSLVKEDYIHVAIVGVENPNEESISIFPNPSKGPISINLKAMEDEDVTINILGPNGSLIKKIENVPTSNEFSLNLSDYPVGTYYLNIIGENKLITAKLSLSY